MRPSRPALPFSDVVIEEKTSDLKSIIGVSSSVRFSKGKMGQAHGVIDDILIPCVVVNVNGDTSKSRNFGGKLGKTGIVLPGASKGRGQ